MWTPMCRQIQQGRLHLHIVPVNTAAMAAVAHSRDYFLPVWLHLSRTFIIGSRALQCYDGHDLQLQKATFFADTYSLSVCWSRLRPNTKSKKNSNRCMCTCTPIIWAFIYVTVIQRHMPQLVEQATLCNDRPAGDGLSSYRLHFVMIGLLVTVSAHTGYTL